MEQEEVFGCRFPGIKLGSIFDLEYGRMADMDAAVTKKCLAKVNSSTMRQSSLMNLASKKKTLYEFIWLNDFIKAKEKNCFLLSLDSSYSETLDFLNFIAKGTVTELSYKRSILILVCSEDENSDFACSSYIKKIIAGTEAKLDEGTCVSCKKCFIYDRYVAGDTKKRSFDSVMHCLKEVSRIIEEMKKWENFHLWSWMYLKENYFNVETLPVNESLSDEASFYKTKLFDATDTKYQSPGSSPAQHNFGHEDGKHRLSRSNVTDEARNNTIIGVHKSTLTVRLHSDSRNSDTFNSPLNANHSAIVTQCASEKSSNYESVKENFIDSNERVTANKAHDVTGSSLTNNFTPGSSYLTDANLDMPETTLIDVTPNEVIEDKEPYKEAMLIIADTDVSNTSVQIVYKTNTTSHMKESSTLSKNLPEEIVHINDDAQIANHPDPINSTFNKIACATSISCPSVLEDGIESHSQGTKESIANYQKSNVMTEENKVCELNDEINESKNYGKQTKGNCRKRTSGAERITLNGPSIMEPGPNDRRQVKKHKTENFIECFGKKIAQTLVEEDGIRKVEIGTKICEQKSKVIVLLGATGSGKSSIVNLCANFYFGSQNADDKKLFIIDSKVKTDRVTVYTFHPEGDSQFPLTVVDTPGLNDSTGAEIHDHVDALKSFLALACSQGMEINALCFLAQAHLVRLTSSEKLVMDYVRSLFGSEVEKHIMVFVTFSDNQPTPPVIEAMEKYGFAKPFFVKFNNTLLISETETVDDLDRIYWRTGLRSWKKCLKHLSAVDTMSNVAISSVKNEVFNKIVLNKHKSNLDTEIRNFITMCNKKKKVEEFYSDKELLRARYKLWMASNDAYSVEANMRDKTKELYLIDACQLQLKKESILVRSAVIKLFLLLDQESPLSCVLTNIVSAFLKCLGVFNVYSEAQGNFLTTFCIGCEKCCTYEKLYCDQSCRIMKYRCNCSHPNGLHGPFSETSSLRFFGKHQLYVQTARSIWKEISKYEGLNCDVDGLWTVGQVLRSLQFSKPDEYRRYDLDIIFGNLSNLAEHL